MFQENTPLYHPLIKKFHSLFIDLLGFLRYYIQGL
jgi:hypothetical protein